MLDNDDTQQREVQKINEWMDEHPKEAVNLFLENEIKIEDGYILTDKFIDLLYDKFSDEIFDYLSEHQEEMR